MEIKLNFFGAARNVTGSCYCVDANGTRVFVDCGMYQERDLKHRNWAPFPVPANSVDAVILTHAHLDHCGRLPKLARDGFQGTVYCTPATADIATIVMLDSAKIQMEDAAYKRRRHRKEGRTSPHGYDPLYTVENVENVASRIKTAGYGSPVEIGDGVRVLFQEAGHILGSTSVKLLVTQGGETRSIVFSGDLGQWHTPIVKDPEPFEEADYVLIESTYGNRLHKDNTGIPVRLEKLINETFERGGNVLIPSFSVERAQELLYHLNGLVNEQRIPHTKVFMDSPMAIRVTEVFKRHPELFDEETMSLLRSGDHPCDFPGLDMCTSVDESKAINDCPRPCIVIAGSGMCTGGRIKHHLIHNVGRPESTVLFVGYQAQGTLGRRILEGDDPVRILGREFDMRCRVAKVNGFSAHADRDELLKWISSLKSAPRRVFVTHGESTSADAFRDCLEENTGWHASVAEYDDAVTLD